MQSKLFYFLIILFLTTSAFCQLDNLKWQKADISYEKPTKQTHRDYSFEADNAGEFITKSLTNLIGFLSQMLAEIIVHFVRLVLHFFCSQQKKQLYFKHL